MGLVTVIISFVVCLSLNVFLKSLDIYSDVQLTTNTLTFNLGNTLLLTGCKICHNKENEDIYELKNKSCYQCVSKNYNFQCGHSFAMVNKLNELENSNTCIEVDYNLYLNETTNDYDFKNEKCGDENVCCIQKQ